MFLSPLTSRRPSSAPAIELRSQIIAAISLLWLVLSPGSAAQTVTGSISGTVVDSSGAVIPAANITLISSRTRDIRSQTTNAEGRFVFSAVPPDAYTVKAEKQGFDTLEQTNVILSVNENLALGKLGLNPGRANEVVIVTEGGGKVETETSDLTARLTADQIDLISTKGRDITSLLRLIPGTSYIDDVESVGEGFGTDLPNLNGQRGRSTVSNVDGLNASEPSGSNKISMTTNQDAIAEVKVLRNNMDAEYGNNGGAIINIVTKSGGKSYHGGGYYYLRNEALNANSYLNNNRGLPRALYRHNIWGANFGGPVQIPKIFPNPQKEKLFFFYSFERPHTITPTSTVFATVPTALERQGDFSQSLDTSKRPLLLADPQLIAAGKSCSYDRNNVPTIAGCFPGMKIPQSRWNSNTAGFLNVFPLPNTILASGQNYQVQKSVNVPKWSQILHIDFLPTEKDSFFWKGQQWSSDNEGFDTSGWRHNDDARWGIDSHYLYKERGMTVGWTHTFTPNLVNESNVSVRHDSEGFIPGAGMVDMLSRNTLHYTIPQIFPGNNKLGLIPQVSGWGGVRGTPARIFWLNRWGETGNDYILPSITDNLTFARSNHTYKFGVYHEHLRNAEAGGGDWQGTFDFGTISGDTGYGYGDALLGIFKTYTEDKFRPHANLGIHIVQWYAQDQWKVKSRLTLNYGLRVAYHTQFVERDGLASNFDPSRWDPAQAPLLYRPFCTVATPIGTSCPSANQFAVDPRVTHPTKTQQLDKSLVGTFVPGTGNQLNGIVQPTDPGTPDGFKRERPINWEPRLGLAWDLTGAGRTVLRAMGGVYHSPRPGGGTGFDVVSNPPYQAAISISGTSSTTASDLSDITRFKINPVGPGTVNAVAVESKTPTIYNFQLGIQHEIGWGTLMEVDYVGSQARHLGQKMNINSVPDTARFVDCTVFAAVGCHPENRNPFSGNGAISDNFLRPYPGLGSINLITYNGSSNYNALQVQVLRRYTRGFQFGIAYTYSKALDYASDDSSDINAGRPLHLFNYGPTDFDQKHIFTANYIWRLPSPQGFAARLFGGWIASGTTSLVSGQPEAITVTFNSGSITPTAGKCRTGYLLTASPSSSSQGTCSAITDLTGGQVNARPNVVCDPNQGARGSAGQNLPILINTSCFARPGIAEIGNLRRNSVRDPGLITTDLAVFKEFHMTERAKLRFSWETYNLLNHTNFKALDSTLKFDPDGTQTNPTFGTPNDVRSPRVMQGSLRMTF